MFMKNNYNKHMKLIRLLSLLLVLPAFFSCSRAEPTILYGYIELVYHPGRVGPEERYSFFILPEDDDGVDNLSELYLYHDREGLRWLFTSDDWIQHEENGRTWIGSRNIAMHGNAPLPRGQYRAVLFNKGGESTERRFTYDSPETSIHPFPLISVSDGSFHIESQYPVNRLIGYNQQGEAVQTLDIREHTGEIRNMRFLPSVRTISLWAENPEFHVSAITDAVAIR
jgi:hypothetical protein